MNNITHLAIHHDPEGRCNYLLEKHIPDLRSLFVDGFIVTTKGTFNNQETKNLLEKAGFRLTVRNLVRETQLDTAGHIALVAGYSKGKGDILFFGCLDRTLHWLEHYPEELKKILNTGMVGNDYLILSRTERALKTHPETQLKPEIFTNEITAPLLAMPGVDVATGCRMLTKETAQDLVRFLAKESLFTNKSVGIGDSLWPYIVRLLGRNNGFIRTEGLEFETPDQYSEEIKKLGYKKWLEQNFTAANIEARMLRVKQTEQTLITISEKCNTRGGSKEQVG